MNIRKLIREAVEHMETSNYLEKTLSQKLGKSVKLHLDELPQLINIIMDDMSFFGPRPERPEFVKAFVATIPRYNERHRIKPGLTGLAQVMLGYEATASQKLQYDLYYMENSGLPLNLFILLRTLWVVITMKGAR